MESKPNVELTKDLMKLLVDYYRFDFEKFDYDKYKGWECFSRPSLELHICNSRVNLPGNRVCTECHSNVDIPCQIGCDLQSFCLAVFAYRIGIGGNDLNKAIYKNLYKKSPDELYDEITVVLSCGLEALKNNDESLEDFIDDVVNDKIKKPVELKNHEVVPDSFVTLWKASKIIEISYTALKAAGGRGHFKVHQLNGKSYVDPKEIEKYNSSSRRKKRSK